MARSFPIHRQTNRKPRRTFRPQAEGLEARRLLNAGELDTTFGVNGPGFTLAGSGWGGARAVQLQSDGKILAAGQTGLPPAGDGYDFRLVRLMSNGALDPAFGTGGSVTTDFAGGQDFVTDSAILLDGRIVVVGRVVNFYTLPGKGNKPVTTSNNDIGLACYLAADTTIGGVLYKAGTLDPRFGTGGKVMTNIRTTDGVKSTDYAQGVIVQEDGKIVVGGMTSTGSGTYDAVLVRYNTNGSIDDGTANDATPSDSFGSGGIVQTPLDSHPSNGVWDLKLLRDPTNPANDKIVTMEAPLSSYYSVMVARYNILDGSLDPTFGTNGRSTIATLPGHSLGDWNMALQPDGSAVVTGYDWPTNSPKGSFLLRYTNTGQLDPTFGTDGSRIILFGAATGDTGYSVAIQPNGKIVVAGTSDSTPGSFVARFDTHGAIDTTFGALVNPADPSGPRTGYARDIFPNTGSSFQSSNGLILQSDGQIVVVGNGITSTTTIVHGKPQTTSLSQFLIARYQGDPVAPLSAANAAIGGVPSIDPSAATGSRSRMGVADHYHPLSAETHEPGRWQTSGQAELGLTPWPLEPVASALPTARLAIGLSKRLRPAPWFPSDVRLE